MSRAQEGASTHRKKEGGSAATATAEATMPSANGVNSEAVRGVRGMLNDAEGGPM